jgi:hypothetical protein
LETNFLIQAQPSAVKAKLLIFLEMCLLYHQFHPLIPQSGNVICMFCYCLEWNLLLKTFLCVCQLVPGWNRDRWKCSSEIVATLFVGTVFTICIIQTLFTICIIQTVVTTCIIQKLGSYKIAASVSYRYDNIHDIQHGNEPGSDLGFARHAN